MAFKYGTTSPTAIKYNGTDLTVLKYGTTAVWGKPYSLTITKDSYTTVTVNRTSSPNQGASTGNLSSGSVVYYGDVLKITATANSGYNRTTFKVNGLDYGDSITITVTSAITVEAYSSPAQSWKTVWTGSTNIAYNTKPSSTAKRDKSTTINGVIANVPTRITVSQVAINMNTTSNQSVVSSAVQTFGTSCGVIVTYTSGATTFFADKDSTYFDTASIASGNVAILVKTPTSANTITIKDIVYRKSITLSVWIGSFVITKVEQYY